MMTSDDRGIEMMERGEFPPVPSSIEVRRFEGLEQQASASSLHGNQSVSSFWTDHSLVRHDSELSRPPPFQQRTAVVAQDGSTPIINPQEQAPPRDDLLPRLDPAFQSEERRTTHQTYQVQRFIKYTPLTAWAVVLAIASTLITVHLRSIVPPEISSSDVGAMGTNTKFVNECLRAIRAHFMGVDAYRLDVGAPQFSATEWLAVNDNVCSYLALNSTRLEQRYALLTVYYASGASNAKLKGWDNEPNLHECNWENVVCDATDYVTAITLGTSEARDPGHVPDQIALLSSLTILDLENNRIGGTLPIGLYSLTNLETLDLSRNSISGTIPTLIGRLSNLKNLDLRYNRLKGTLSHEIASLGSLRIFNVQQNDISGNVWKYIESWPHLEAFDVADNEKIVGTIPTEIGMITNLRVLQARSSQTSGTIPTEIGKLESLEVFNVLATRLEGSLPSELGQLSLLDQLAVDDNNLEGTIPTEIGLCSSLENMKIKQNNFDGTLPSELGLLIRLTDLDASHNNIHGVIPETFERLTDLKTLNLWYNQRLAGEMPPGLCDIQGADIRVECTVSCTCCTNYQCTPP